MICWIATARRTFVCFSLASRSPRSANTFPELRTTDSLFRLFAISIPVLGYASAQNRPLRISSTSRQERSARSFGLGLQFRQVGVQLVLRDSLATVQLLNAAPDLRVDRFPALGKPAILLLLCFQQAKQHLFNAGGAGSLELSLDAGLESRIVDFDVHCPVLHAGSTFSFSS